MALKASYTASAPPCSPATGKSLANMQRPTPKVSIACRTKGRMLSTVQSWS